MYDIRDRIRWFHQQLSTTDVELEKVIGGRCELIDHYNGSILVTAVPEKASSKSEEVVGQLSLDLCDDSTSVAALELEEVVIADPLAKAAMTQVVTAIWTEYGEV